MSKQGVPPRCGPPSAGLSPIDDGLARDLAVCALDLARRFAAGATMWSVAPLWAEHARHVAVEFVHPVIVGKRALPAVSMDAPEPIGALRAIATRGDVLVLIGDATTRGASPLLLRCSTWGLTTVWIGAGERPPAGAADHVLWVDGVAAGAARHNGSVVRLYHLLWELTHVCFEHSGMVPPPPVAHGGQACTTCADDARPAEVISVDRLGSASVRTAAGVETVDTTIIAPVDVGDLVLVHAGTAIAVVREDPS
jgi:hypothetical protein